jgi:hypothetical protein
LPQEGDHVSIWFSGNLEVCRGWYDGKVSKKMKTRSRARSNVEVWFLEDDDGSSAQAFRFDAHNYERAANWVLRDVLDNACGDARCCDYVGGST